MQFRTFSAHFLSNLSNSALLVAFLFKSASERNLPGTALFWRHFFPPTWPSSGPVLPHLRPQKSVPARQVRIAGLNFRLNLSNSACLAHFCSNHPQNRNLPGTDRFWVHIFHSTWPSVGPVLPHLRPQESVPARQIRTVSLHFPSNLSNSALLVALLLKTASERNLPGTDPFRRHLFHSTWPFFGPVLTHLRPQESVSARQAPKKLCCHIFRCGRSQRLCRVSIYIPSIGLCFRLPRIWITLC